MSYYSLKLFDNANVNSICDKLIYYLKENFPQQTIIENFGLSGTASLLKQNATSGNSNRIVFVCSDADVYNFCLNSMSNLLKPIETIKFKERVLFTFEFVKIEIWYYDMIIDFTVDQDVNFQIKTQIPAELL